MVIVCGGSSVGKSTFLKSKKIHNYIDFTDKKNIKMMHAYNLKQKCEILHYNILKTGIVGEYDYAIEQKFIDIIKIIDITNVFVLAAPKDIILKRISKRQKIEKDFGNLGEYQAQYFTDLYKSIDLYKLYSVIVDFLKENNIKYTMLDSRNKNYEPIDSSVTLKHVLEDAS